ncbi:CHAP and LysM peptidoglycan-binding domain-containing protein [Enterococcus sp. LJL90]
MKASDVVALATRELGTPETPLGSNNVKYNTFYYGRAVSGSAYPWCQAFIWWLFSQLNATSLIGSKTAYTVNAASQFASRGQWHTSNPQIGDIIFYSSNGSKSISSIVHVGIVVTVSGDTVTAIEGNYANKVSRVIRRSNIVGYGRPAYGSESSNSAPPASNGNTTSYTVVAGDSLWKISQKFTTTVASLKQLNNLSSDLIFIGQTLKTSGSSSTPSSNQIAVDGYWGSATTRRIQQVLGITVDGIKGPETYKAIQRKVGTTADGIIGPNTIRAMQRYFGTVQDGVISEPSLMVKAMQTRLNQNKF